MSGETIGVLLAVLGFALVIGLMALWIWMIVDCATKERSDGNDKLVWILIIVLAGWIGALVYYFVRRPKRMKELGI